MSAAGEAALMHAGSWCLTIQRTVHGIMDFAADPCWSCLQDGQPQASIMITSCGLA